MDKKMFFLGIGLAVVMVFCGSMVISNLAKVSQSHADRGSMYQVSTMNALAQGAFEGIQPVSELKKHGDFGIGTFDGLDGEMIVLNGNVYHAMANGSVRIAMDSETTPFSEVAYFNRDFSVTEDHLLNYSEFASDLSAKLPSENGIYSVKIHAEFPSITVRAIPRQEPPYISLLAASANESVYTYQNMTGTIVGFYEPEYLSGVGAPGYHLHFISDDGKHGGHILDMTVPSGTVAEFGTLHGFTMILPEPGAPTKPDPGRNLTTDIARAEHANS